MAKSIFLVAHYYMRPRGRATTQIKGWMSNNDNLQYDEQVAITRNLKKSDLSTAKIIMDLTKKSVVRNGWNNLDDFDKLFGYFHEGYPQYTTTVMHELDPSYLERFNVATTTEAPVIAAPTSEIVEVDTSTATINT